MSAPTQAPAATRVSLLAPVTGVLVPIEQVPDPVFAGRMVGEGVSIDPLENTLVAPCDGEVVHLHPSLHALTVAPPRDWRCSPTSAWTPSRCVARDSPSGQGRRPGQGGRPADRLRPGHGGHQAKSLLTQMVIANTADMLPDWSRRPVSSPPARASRRSRSVRTGAGADDGAPKPAATR